MCGLADSQALRAIRRVAEHNDEDNFITEIISIQFSSVKAYDAAITHGIAVNKKSYVRFMASANQVKTGTIYFIRQDLLEQIDEILENGRDLGKPLVLAKYNAYDALYLTGTTPISAPKRVLVVKDYLLPESKSKRTVDFVSLDDNGVSNVGSKDIKPDDINCFDGQGIVSAKMMAQIASELEIDYTPSCVGIRQSFLKGMLCCMDIAQFIETYKEQVQCIILDAWDNPFDIDEPDGIDMIITTSMLKLWDSFGSWEEYTQNCENNELQWGVFKVSNGGTGSHCEDAVRRLNYQFIQSLSLSNDDIKDLCKPTVEWLQNISGLDVDYSLLYLLGKIADQPTQDGVFNLDKIQDVVTKTLIINHDLIKDSYVHSYLISSINKKTKDTYIGKIYAHGAYFTMVADPFAMLQYVFLGADNVTGILQNKQYYCNYWHDTKTVAAMRSPMTHSSEVNILHLVNENLQAQQWYRYLSEGCVIYNIFGNDTMLHADSDFDTDTALLTDNPYVIKGKQSGLPITYDKKTAPKQVVIKSKLHETDKLAFGDDIGHITNISTSITAMLPLYKVGSAEYNELQKRLKLCRYYQGNAIDKSKGIIAEDIPEYWTNIAIIEDGDTEDEKEEKNFNNSICCTKAPYFLRYRYSNYEEQYNKYNSAVEASCAAKFGMTFNKLKGSQNFTDNQQAFLDNTAKNSPLLDSHCVMNTLCHYMEQVTKKIVCGKVQTPEKVFSCLFSASISDCKDANCYNKKIMRLMQDRYSEFKAIQASYKKSKQVDADENIVSLNQFCVQLYKDIIRSAKKIDATITDINLTDYALYICYVKNPTHSKNFAWKIFGQQIVNNLFVRSNGTATIPFRSDEGSINYLGRKYKMGEVHLTKNDR